MRIKLVKSCSGIKFPYGCASREDKVFVKEHVGEEFEAERANMNYYVLDNGVTVHVYNAMDMRA